MKNVYDFDKREHSWNILNYFFGYFIRNKGKEINKEHVWGIGFGEKFHPI